MFTPETGNKLEGGVDFRAEKSDKLDECATIRCFGWLVDWLTFQQRIQVRLRRAHDCDPLQATWILPTLLNRGGGGNIHEILLILFPKIIPRIFIFAKQKISAARKLVNQPINRRIAWSNAWLWSWTLELFGVQTHSNMSVLKDSNTGRTVQRDVMRKKKWKISDWIFQKDFKRFFRSFFFSKRNHWGCSIQFNGGGGGNGSCIRLIFLFQVTFRGDRRGCGTVGFAAWLLPRRSRRNHRGRLGRSSHTPICIFLVKSSQRTAQVFIIFHSSFQTRWTIGSKFSTKRERCSSTGAPADTARAGCGSRARWPTSKSSTALWSAIAVSQASPQFCPVISFIHFLIVSGASNKIWREGLQKITKGSPLCLRFLKKVLKGPPFAYVFWENRQRVPPLLTFFEKNFMPSPPPR